MIGEEVRSLLGALALLTMVGRSSSVEYHWAGKRQTIIFISFEKEKPTH